MIFLSNPKKFFLLTATLFGLIYVFIIPPFQSPDETSHYFRIIHLTDGNLVGIKKNNRQGGNINEAYIALKNEFYNLRFNNGKIQEDHFLKAFAINKNEFGSHFVDFPNTSYYSPTVYFPQIFGCLIGIWIDNPLISFYLIRLATFFIWVVIIYVSLGIIPFHRWTFAFLALLPSSLFLHSSMNGDTLTNALSFLLVGLILKKVVCPPKQNNIFFIFTVFLLTVIILLNKIVYFPLIGLILLIPDDWFYGKRQKLIQISTLFILIFLVFIGWYHLTKNQFLSYDNYNPLYRTGLQLNEGVHPGEQISFVLHNPLIFMKIAIASYWDTKLATIAHYVGKFGWEKNYIPTLFIGLLLILILINAFFEKSKQQFVMTNKFRIVFVFIAIVMTGGLTLLMYLHWHPVGADRVTNLSGRYFIPIFPLLFLALKNQRFELKHYDKLRIATCFVLWLALASGVWSAYFRYWA